MTPLALAVLLASAVPARALDVEWASVRPGGYSSSIRVTGHVAAQEGALMVESARVQGRVTKILRREGETVTPGDALFLAAGPECLSLANERRVAETRGLSELIEAVARREEQLSLRVTETDCRFIASHGGTLSKRQVEVGASFNVGDALFTIVDISRLGVELDVPERNLSHLKPGQAVRVELASALGRTILGTVESVLPTIDAATRAGRVRLKAPSLPRGTTLDALAFAEIETGERRQAFKVPAAAIVFNKNRQYVLKKTSKAPIAVPIEVLSETESAATVRPAEGETLKLGDQIAVKGAIFLLQSMKDGA